MAWSRVMRTGAWARAAPASTNEIRKAVTAYFGCIFLSKAKCRHNWAAHDNLLPRFTCWRWVILPNGLCAATRVNPSTDRQTEKGNYWRGGGRTWCANICRAERTDGLVVAQTSVIRISAEVDENGDASEGV